MKRWILWGCAAALAVLLKPAQGIDIGKLQPVELVQVYREEGNIVIETDAGDLGRGEKLEDALKNLKRTTPAEVFLETADFLLLTEETRDMLPELAGILRPGTEGFLILEPVDGETAAQYLENHSLGSTIQTIQSEKRRLPRLKTVGERFELEEQW